jgi:uncharacterized protein (TIGR03437 family)
MADTSLRKSLRLSMFPAAGVIEGRPSQATLTIEHAAEADLVVSLTAASGVAAIPGSVRIPAGATSATFSVRPVRAGVEEIRAEPLDGAYDIASAKVQVSPAAALRLVVVSGDRQTITPGAPLPQPVVIRLTDENALPYAGVTMVVSAPDGGSISPLAPVTDADGRATIEWTPGSAANAQLSFMVAGVAQSPIARVTASRPGTVTAISVVNAASYESAVSPGAIATIYGSNLSTGSSRTAAFPWPEILDGVRVLVNGRPSPVLYVSGGQVNFLAPPDLPQGTAGVVVATGAGSSAPIPMTVRPTAPGIFFDTNSGHGAILNAGTAATTFARPAARGGTIEIYCTGLGPVRDARPGVRETVMQPDVRVDDIAASVLYSGLAPGYLGLYQVNITVPAALAPGIHQLSIGVNGVRSNFVRLAVQ